MALSTHHGLLNSNETSENQEYEWPSSDGIELETLENEEYPLHDGRGSPDVSIHRPESIALQTYGYTVKEENDVLRKLDRHLVLFLALLYMLSFLDRSSMPRINLLDLPLKAIDIGNAKIAGLTDDLSLDSAQYEWVLTAFYITQVFKILFNVGSNEIRYILFEWMTLLYRIISPHIYISLCVAAWGLIASLQCLAGSFASLLILRACLGISEAAFGPGVPFYLSFFYNREELAFRTGLFISAAPLATSFASSLAWLIVKAGTYSPIAPWRLLFLVEGFPSVVVALFAWSFIPDSPSTAKFLSTRQRKIAQMRLSGHASGSEKSKLATRSRFQWKEIGQTLKDPRSYITAMMFFCCNVAFSSLPPFLPTIIKEMHYSALTSQALSAPPYLFAFGVVIFTTWASDRRRSRSPFLLFHSCLGAFGYGWLALSGYFRWPSLVRYAGTFPAAAGFFSAVALTITWTMDNRHAAEGKGTGVALINIVGQLGPLVGTRLYPDDDAPYYVKGMSICAGFMLAVGILTIILRTILQRENNHLVSESAYEALREGDDVLAPTNECSKHLLHSEKVVNIL